MTSREYLRDHWENGYVIAKPQTKGNAKLAHGAARKHKTKRVHSIPSGLNSVLNLKAYFTKYKGQHFPIICLWI